MHDVSKAFNTYHRAWAKLVGLRDQLYPEGTMVRNKLTGTLATVMRGSLYADQVNTDKGHMGWDWLETISNVEKTS